MEERNVIMQLSDNIRSSGAYTSELTNINSENHARAVMEML
jgi:hypothetical protein